MTMQNFLSLVRRACEEYSMISPGDKIAVALSGGKDSLSVLAALAEMRRFYPAPYTLTAITVDLGFPGFETDRLERYCESIDVPFALVKTDIGRVVFTERAEKNPCSLCAKMRKGALNAEALRAGCTRVAYGHTVDDMVQTFFMSLFYEGRLHAPQAVTYLDRSGLRCIRPLVCAREKDVAGFAKRHGLPVTKNPCPADGNTKREETKRLISDLRLKYDHFDSKMQNAIKRLMEE